MLQQPQRRTKHEVIAEAMAFSAAHNSSGAFPIPIDAMAERLGLFIIEIPELRKVAGVAGEISKDLSEIQIDAILLKQHRDSYRHTIAHELAHAVLHRELILSFPVEDKQSWKEFLALQDPGLSDQVEKEARIFARYVLVPTTKLVDSWNMASALLVQQGRKMADLTDESKSVIASNIARQFIVPSPMVQRRLIDEQLYE
ncbi:MAG: ImmA/IrrE family metallo-endopeptidase [Fimbriimonas sp.]|nr:ImmA/IrrE family metallo-endopeptidase [Fimbriimonas sp.]